MSSDCLFCRIVAREIPAAIVAENEQTLAFRDIAPQAPTHVLVIPKEHVASLNEATSLVVEQVLRMVATVARQEGVAERGYRTVVNTHSDGGQTVAHLHAHVLGGRHMKWPPG